MKKIKYLVVCVLICCLSFVLVACDFGNNDNNNAQNPGSEIQKPETPSGNETTKPTPGEGETEKPVEKPEEPPKETPDEGDDKEETIKIENIGDLISNYQIEMYNALNSELLENVGKDCLGRTFKTEKVSNATWYINDSRDRNEISDFTLKFNYAANNGYTEYIVCSVKIGNKIEINDFYNANIINSETIKNAFSNEKNALTCKQEYSFTYNEENFTTNVALKNAICDKFFGEITENENVKRYIVDQGPRVDGELGENYQFKVVEITEEGVKEVTIRIKDPLNGKDYIDMLDGDEANYSVLEKNEVPLSGNKIEKIENKI